MEDIVDASELKKWTEQQNKLPDRIWKMFFDSVADPVFILSESGVILFCNKASTEFLGLSQKEITGSHCYERVHATAGFIEGCPFVKAMKSKKRESYQFLINDRWYMVSVDPVINCTGDVIGAVHFITDINEIVSLDAARTNLAGIIENTGDAVAGIARDGTVDYWNKGASELFGYSEDEITKKSVELLFPEENTSHLNDIIEEIITQKKAVRLDAGLLSKAGDEIEVSVSFQPMLNERGEIKGISFTAHDLSPERKAERELLSFVTESALRLNRPVEIIKNNIEDIKELLQSGKISQNDACRLLDVQISNADRVLENLRELNCAVVEQQKTIPDSYAEFLKR